ncbi:recombinase family protein [Fictibacillus barbaricus]|uniref:DNA invertase Pin-like site-specific DNA recombinase n=1 Tax=Fictibacillus barbaricus TaxID=182136 RepID=A0ABU1U5C9_9BACL|nr:recombinase family protein [Fictibacillus barbaricus]MDR7074678.1 DNA invertase Pin-like site-specific DNA recombinase [Fictibacillus barbaricus]
MKQKKEILSVDEIIKNAERIAFYSRVSTKEQEKEKDEGQQYGKVSDFLNRYDKTVNDDAKFSDTGSAYSKPFTERKNLEALLHAVENKEFDAIVVSDRDRLSRQTEEHFQLRLLLEKIGVPVVIASRGELYDSEDFIRTLVEDALTRLESDNISTRTKATLKSLLDREKYIGGAPPYGYEPIVDDVKKVKKEQKVVRFKPVHKELSNVKKVFHLYKKSETFSSIANTLNKKNPPKKWTATRVKEIITNPIYTGHLVYNRYEKESRNFAPIEQWKWFKCSFIQEKGIVISEEDWWYCWHKYTKTKDKRPRFLNTSFYMNDLLRCYCGGLMMGRDKRTNLNRKKGKKVYGFRYYICPKCKEKIKADVLNNLVLDLIFKMTAPKDLTIREVKKMIAAEIVAKEIEILQLKNDIQYEKNNLNVLKMFEKNGDKKDGMLLDSEQHDLLAYLLSKADSEGKLKSYKVDLPQMEEACRKLKEIHDMDGNIEGWVDLFFRYKRWKSLTNLEIRNLVLLLIEECSLITSTKVKLKIKSLLPETLDLSGK